MDKEQATANRESSSQEYNRKLLKLYGHNKKIKRGKFELWTIALGVKNMYTMLCVQLWQIKVQLQGVAYHVICKHMLLTFVRNMQNTTIYSAWKCNENHGML